MQKIDLEDSVNDFLYYFNDVEHSITKMEPYKIMRN